MRKCYAESYGDYFGSNMMLLIKVHNVYTKKTRLINLKNGSI